MPKSCGMYLGYQFYYGIHKDATKEALSINKEFWLSLITLIGVLTVMILGWNTPVGFGLAWFCLFTAQYCGMITVTQTVSERTQYLSLVGICLALGYSFVNSPIILIGLIIAYILKSWDVSEQYYSMESMLRYNMKNNPDSPHSYISMITSYYLNKNIIEGLAHARTAISLFPDDAYINLLYSAGLVGIGNIKLGEIYLNLGIEKMENMIEPDVNKEVSRETYLIKAIKESIKNKKLFNTIKEKKEGKK